MDQRPAIDPGRDMTTIAAPDPILMSLVQEWQTRNDRHSIIAFLATIGVMRPACLGKRLCREMHILGLGFLKTQHIDVMILDKIQNQLNPQSDRIDIPCC
jgi:hypothetical protein